MGPDIDGMQPTHLCALRPGDQGLADLTLLEHRRSFDVIPLLLQERINCPARPSKSQSPPRQRS